ncbi:hypothetical protein BDA96_01G367700 [Sorghum bicolor]|uniref:Uncharacterized protein n=2 Tax=Sorghum bicolor TaxID=4558 RepID=A0A921S3G8_SORBI|nr:uncharacterized protein LOC8080435 [Sorghum bicolor]EER92160.1 hypothetical protein SORBI_3001G344600 [Sorghum bicolor]KAG0550789.1 hypothetical protein BDA96_01G367700 [Sorghum bicolor]KAG0550790.1 hypothetical protein BDA96_01G367700 [Sorghum bicolor]|eukprot:XP_002465162.1 uncharacterized protein LOC8080435 [Sorghum bicolor]
MSSKIGSSFVSSLICRRSYGVYATAVNVQHASAAAAVAATPMAKTDVVAAAADASRAKQDDKFWMRDPKTGCWIPENRFQEVDVVDLRNRLICHK